jgi:ABC-2 type transport system ATP-binding protein
MSVVLQTRGLRKSYRSVVALQGLDLEVHAGEVFGFLGPNGAGKTTFTKCVTGFVRPQGGSVVVMGIDALAHPTRAATHIGLVPDQYDFYSNLTGRQHLDFYGRLHGMPAAERRARVLEVVRMTERADSRVKSYSHGMKQRICIAQAILHRPQLVLFDEPTNGLDPQGAYELRELIKGLARDGTTIFLNSHLLTEVEQTCQRVAILDRGRLVTVAGVADLKKRAAAGGGEVRIRVLNPSARLGNVAKASGARLEGDTVVAQSTPQATAALVAALVAAGGQVVEVASSSGSLEQAFLGLTRGGA